MTLMRTLLSMISASMFLIAGCGAGAGGDSVDDPQQAEPGRDSGSFSSGRDDSGSFSSGRDDESGQTDGPGRDDPGRSDAAGGAPEAEGVPSDADPAGPGTADQNPEDSDEAGEDPAGGGDPAFAPPTRSDGIILVFDGVALGPVPLGATPSEVQAALGPEFEMTPVKSIRPGFDDGYSVSRDGEVLFWAVDDEGQLDLFMTTNPQVGLESGLRPRLPLADAIDLHGEPTLSLGPEQREFASFADGSGLPGQVSVLVAIGQFGGPVGLYDGPVGEFLEEADGYVLDDANIKELWFGG